MNADQEADRLYCRCEILCRLCGDMAGQIRAGIERSVLDRADTFKAHRAVTCLERAFEALRYLCDEGGAA